MVPRTFRSPDAGIASIPRVRSRQPIAKTVAFVCTVSRAPYRLHVNVPSGDRCVTSVWLCNWTPASNAW